jgi:hypothetical protein
VGTLVYRQACLRAVTRFAEPHGRSVARRLASQGLIVPSTLLRPSNRGSDTEVSASTCAVMQDHLRARARDDVSHFRSLNVSLHQGKPALRPLQPIACSTLAAMPLQTCDFNQVVAVSQQTVELRR